MENEPGATLIAGSNLGTTRVLGMAGLCLVAGLGIGYLLRGQELPSAPARNIAIAAPVAAPGGMKDEGRAPGLDVMRPMAEPETQGGGSVKGGNVHGGAMSGGRMPTMADMKRMADKQAGPLLEKLKSDPQNAALLMQVGAMYHTTHQFKDAAAYYGRAVEIEPRNLALRSKLASSLYRSGDVDGAIAQLNQALTYDPKDAPSLFNLGTIKLQGKQDGKGALAAWQLLLKSNPQLSPERKAFVQKLMADVLTTMSNQQGTEGAARNDGHK